QDVVYHLTEHSKDILGISEIIHVVDSPDKRLCDSNFSIKSLHCKSICLIDRTVEYWRLKLTKLDYSLLQSLVWMSEPVQCFSSRRNLQVASMVIPSFQNGYAHTLLTEIELSALIDAYHWLSVIAYCFLDQTLNYYSNSA
ncbi:hypothetical protein E2I00_007956, partial [Balaenoptera physalus]